MAAISPLRPTLSTGAALAAARPQIVRFLTYDRIRDLLETLRSRARVVSLVKPVGEPASNLSTSVLSTSANEGRS